MKRRWAVLGVGALGVVAIFTVGKAVLNLASEPEAGTPSTGDLLPLPSGLSVIAETTFESQGSLGGGTRVLVLGREGADGRDRGAAASYLDALEARGWARPSPSAAIPPDQSFCVVADDLPDFLADPDQARDVKDFVRARAPGAQGVAVVTAGIC